MRSIVAGDGGMGRAVAAALAERGTPPGAVLGMPNTPHGHAPARFHEADLLFDFSVGDAVLANVSAALQGGVRYFVIGTTNWAGDRAAVEAMLIERDATAVASANFSLGATLFARLVEDATRLFGSFADYDPYLLEWHRRSKADRPSGTAIELSRRVIAAHPRKTRVASPVAYGAPAPEELDVAVIRAGSAPGMHLVGFDAPGESLEMRRPLATDRGTPPAPLPPPSGWWPSRELPASTDSTRSSTRSSPNSRPSPDRTAATRLQAPAREPSMPEPGPQFDGRPASTLT